MIYILSMKNILKFENFNPKINKKVEDYVDDNIFLLSHLYHPDLSETEQRDYLIEYFKKYPNEMKSSLDKTKITTFKKNKSDLNWNVKVNNIGGHLRENNNNK